MITADKLLEAGAQPDCVALVLFRKAFPRGLKLSSRNVRRALRAGMDVAWAIAHLPGVRGMPGLVPALAKALGDPDAGVRWGAVCALGKIGPAAKAAVPALEKALGDPNAGVRGGAACALGEIGPAAKAIVPALEKALGDPNAWVRWGAVRALRRLQGAK